MARDDYASGPEDVEQGPLAEPAEPADPAASREENSLLRQLRRGTIVDGKYRIDQRLGRGSMGIVVSATHIHLDERVALKFLHSQIQSSSDDFQARFQREAQMSAKLRGEHVARVIDIGLWQDRYPFMVMDHLTGVDLRSTRKAWGGALSVDLATEYVVQICEGMAEAHALGIVHCDLKPSNIFVTKRADGSDLIKILDFGISKWTMHEDPNEDVSYTGVVLGSPKYMAPERLLGSSMVDARADIWSIGALYYELLVGRPPFDFPTLRLMFEALREQSAPPSLREKNAWVTPALEAVVMRCLAHDRERRIANVAELAGAILDAVGEPYANEVQARLEAVLDAHGARDSLVGAVGARASRISGQLSPGIRSAHTEGHAGARRQAASIPPPLPSRPPPLPVRTRGSNLSVLMTHVRQVLAPRAASAAATRALEKLRELRPRTVAGLAAVLFGAAALALFGWGTRAQPRLSTTLVPVAQPASALEQTRPASERTSLPLAPAVTPLSVSPRLPSERDTVRASQPQRVPAAQAVTTQRDSPRGAARVRRERGEHAPASVPSPAAESGRPASAETARPPSAESPASRVPAARTLGAGGEKVWGMPSEPAAEAPARPDKVWGLPTTQQPAAEPALPSRSPLEDRL